MTPQSNPRDQAVDAIARHLTARDRTNPADRPDAEIDAAVILQALTGLGYRPTAARPAPAWAPRRDRSTDPGTAHRGAAAAREALTRQETDPDEH